MSTPGLLFRPLGVGTQFSGGFSRFAQGVQDWSPALVDIGHNLQRGIAMQFATQGGYGSGGWAPLKPRYAAEKAKHYPGAPILVRTGHMRKAALAPSIRLTPTTLTFGINDRKVVWHQEGTKKMVARPLVELPESQRLEWGKIIHRFLVYRARGR